MSILLIPTLAFSATSWDGVASRLPESVASRTVELPGHGVAATSGFDVTRASAELANWARTCVEPPHVVGSGAGALLAERVARSAPVASLTVIGWPPDQRRKAMLERIRYTRRAMAEQGADEFLTAYRAAAAPRAETEALAAPLSAQVFVEGLEAAARWAPAAFPPGLRVAIVRGSADQRCSADDARTLADLWHGELHEVQGADHATYVDAPSEVARLLTHILRSSRPLP